MKDQIRDKDERQRPEDDTGSVKLFSSFEKTLGGRLLILRFFHEGNELGQRRFGGRLGHAHFDSTVLVQGPGKERIAWALIDR